ncbi:MAG: HAD-IC family P-type ATPase, partial [Clostridia bacterium]|nr:HAD-IC family P-type ATPase [Clostridia bacterium]
VIRDGVQREIYSSELVPGDIVLLKEGDYICADARIIESRGFRCNELFFTGENIPVDKDENAVCEDITDVTARKNMVFCGCSVVCGTAKAVVVGTGLETENGHNETLTEQMGENALPIEDRLKKTGKIVNTVILIVCILVFAVQFIINFRTNNFAQNTVSALMNSIALAVAAIPESLPIISAVVIALGIQRIAFDNVIIKKVKAIELLGKTNVICTDKTGIITSNDMSLTTIFNGNDTVTLDGGEISERNAMTIRLATICSTLQNDSTEDAIKSACLKYNGTTIEELEQIYPRLCTIPFDPERKMMTSVNMFNGNCLAIVKGAAEMVAEKCSDEEREKILNANEELTSKGLRVVAIAIKKLPELPANPNPEEIENNLLFVGLLGLYDPPRDR